MVARPLEVRERRFGAVRRSVRLRVAGSLGRGKGRQPGKRQHGLGPVPLQPAVVGAANWREDGNDTKIGKHDRGTVSAHVILRRYWELFSGARPRLHEKLTLP